MTLSARILEACTVPAGLSLPELTASVDDYADTVNTIAGQLTRAGRLHKAGVRKFFRYFTALEHAQAWDLVAEDDYKARMKASAERKRIAKNARQRTGNPPDRPPAHKGEQPQKPKKPPRKKRAELVLQRAQQATTAPAKPTKIIWPETVKVQVHPTPPSRFAFEPPPGWRGQITNDWMDRRLGAAS